MTEDEILIEYRKGYKDGFADGYKAAIEEVISKQQEQIKKVRDQADTDLRQPGVDPRWWFWPW